MGEMYAKKIEIVPVSPDRFCPHCKRLLIKMHAERGTLDPEDLPEDGAVDGFIEATCLRLICRLRERWASR